MANKKNLKQTAIKYMGGECIVCGYKRCSAALHFHHLNTWEKDYEISSKSNWYDIEKELKKCVLLCANCHAETHAGIIAPDTLVILNER